mmetsp:Transcript_112874/g.353017  ORF Transcript_112874/g.353017 Transcript_112874/m.353017 type:complete len:265 (-) Transcript_112874:854-1648(-)
MTLMETAPPPAVAFAFISLTLAPPTPMNRPTISAGTSISSTWPTLAWGGGWPGMNSGSSLGSGMGQPLAARTSRITASVFEMFPTIETSPQGSLCGCLTLMSAPVRLRMALIVSPPLPSMQRICTACILSTFWPTLPLAKGPDVGCELSPTSCSQLGSSVGRLRPSPCTSHLLLRLRLSPPVTGRGEAPRALQQLRLRLRLRPPRLRLLSPRRLRRLRLLLPWRLRLRWLRRLLELRLLLPAARPSRLESSCSCGPRALSPRAR